MPRAHGARVKRRKYRIIEQLRLAEPGRWKYVGAGLYTCDGREAQVYGRMLNRFDGDEATYWEARWVDSGESITSEPFEVRL